MEKEQIISLLGRVASPVYQIEADLGMPKTTLQKAIKGQRKLPKKWAIKLKEVYGQQEIKQEESPKNEQKENPDQSGLDWKQQLIELRQNKKLK